MKNSKGITLIALIITIIVMLILVAVTINVAMQGGIFGKAETATTKTTRQVEKEQLISAMVGGIQTGGIFDVNTTQLPADMKWCNIDETDYNTATDITPTKNQVNGVITKTNNKFYIDEHGNVLDEYKSKVYVGGKTLLGGKFKINNAVDVSAIKEDIKRRNT